MSWWKSAALYICLATLSKHVVHGVESLSESEKAERRAEIASKEVQTATLEADNPMKRRHYPEKDPLVCLAFLSCCGRTNLLNETLSGVIRHMEEDEPSGLRYEIAWVDNGSGTQLTNDIAESFEIEHALPLEKNMGLAWGMNALIQNLCTAPYVLLLEEDWLYLDEAVAKQTNERKSAVARSVALLRTNPTALAGTKKIIGVQLRDKPNFIDGTRTVMDVQLPMIDTLGDHHDDNEDEKNTLLQTVEYGVSCMELQKTGNVWGSFTNGAGLYSRHSLIEVGRMYGEPDDLFHDAYVESNYAFRVGLAQYCTAGISMEPMCIPSFSNPDCKPAHQTSAFQHIGGGRGTRPRKKVDQKCNDESWMFYGTPLYEQVMKAGGGAKDCSASLPSIDDQLKDNIEFMKKNAELSAKHLEKEQKQREKMLNDVAVMRKYPLNVLRSSVPLFKDQSDEDISKYIDKMEKLATSPHQLDGFWDKLGNIIERDEL